VIKRAIDGRSILVVFLAFSLVLCGMAGAWPALSAYQVSGSKVTVMIENSLMVSPDPISFGTMFPEEFLRRDVLISLSDSARQPDEDGNFNSLSYNVFAQWKPVPPEAQASPVITGGDGNSYYAWLGDCLYVGINATAGASPLSGLSPVGPAPAATPGDKQILDSSGSVLAGSLKFPDHPTDNLTIAIDAPVFEGYYNPATDTGTKPSHLDRPTMVIPRNDVRWKPAGVDLGVDIKIQVGTDAPGPTLHPPVVTCKWEQQSIPASASLEDGDPSHLVAGTQILPVLAKDGKTALEYWAIVSDPAGAGTVKTVKADVFYPSGTPRNGSLKETLILQKVDSVTGKAAYVAARNAGLIAYQPNWAPAGQVPPVNDAEVLSAIDAGTCSIWKAAGQLDSSGPAGDYTAIFDSLDTSDSWAGTANPGTNLSNKFNYLSVAGIEIDFNALNFGSLKANQTGWINGDLKWDSPVAGAPAPNLPTVRNIGNVPVLITLKNDDMGFGCGGTNTQYAGQTLPGPAQSNWNVVYGANENNSPANSRYYDPNVTISLPAVLSPADYAELDFAIQVKSAPEGNYHGTMVVGCSQAP
jgi:hypothetical protein